MKGTILITGAGGYIGTQMVKDFLFQGYKIKALDRYFFGYEFNNIASDNLEIIKDDIRWFNPEILKGVDAVIDLSSISNDPSAELDPVATNAINHLGALNIARKAKELGVKRYILSSSCSIYGAGLDNLRLTEESELNPVSVYAESKINAERDILTLGDNNFSVTFLRNATAYGLSEDRMRFDLVLNVMTLNAWKNQKIFILGGGEQWRPICHIKDIVKAFRMVVEEEDITKINKQAFNVGSNEQNYKIKQVANIFKGIFTNIEIENIPSDPDKRSYNVCFDKINKVLNFKTEFTPMDGIGEITQALNKGLISSDDIRVITVRFYKYLIDADKILSNIKIKNRIF